MTVPQAVIEVQVEDFYPIQVSANKFVMSVSRVLETGKRQAIHSGIRYPRCIHDGGLEV